MKKVLFLEKVFLKERKSPKLRGVELFNFSLIKDLLAQNIEIFSIVHISWKDTFQENFKSPYLHVQYTNQKMSFLSVIFKLLLLKKEKIDILFLANTGDTLLGAMLVSKLFRITRKQVLLAHREPSKAFLITSKFVKLVAVSVNQKFASIFKKAGCPVSKVYYGVKNASKFLEFNIHKDHEKVVFGVVGDLDNKWKGADTAIEAFSMLSKEANSICELRLASYTNNLPINLPNNIKAFKWLPYEEVVNFFNELDVLIVPSYDEKVMRETFSQAMVQGMLSGLPILANDLEILKEKLNQGGGFIFKNSNELKEKIEELAFNKNLRIYLGEKARKVAIQRYIWDTEYFSEKFLR